MKQLTTRQRRFVEEYCVDYNASGAARRAGYSERTAGAIGHVLLKKAEIREEIDRHLDEMSMRAAEAERPLSGSYLFIGSLEGLADQLRSMSLADLEEIWPLVLASPYVERQGDAYWRLRLLLPHW